MINRLFQGKKETKLETVEVAFYCAQHDVFIRNGKYSGSKEEIKKMMESDRVKYNVTIKRGHKKVTVDSGNTHKKQWG